MTTRALVGLAGLNIFVLGVGIAALWALRGWRPSPSSPGSRVSVHARRGAVRRHALARACPRSSFLVCDDRAHGPRAGRCQHRASACTRAHRPAVRGGCSPGTRRCECGVRAVRRPLSGGPVRAGRLAGLSAWDAWAFWVPKAKAICFFGGLDEQFFRELANPTYPPLLPALEASAFHFMGSAMSSRCTCSSGSGLWFRRRGGRPSGSPGFGPCALAVPPLVLVAPRVVGRNLDPQADFLLDYVFALAALLVALWLVDHQPWQLVAASLFLGAAMLTKGEGLPLGCVRSRFGVGRLVARSSLCLAPPRPCGGLWSCRRRPLADLVLGPRPQRRVARGRLRGAVRPSRSCLAGAPLGAVYGLRLRPLGR